MSKREFESFGRFIQSEFGIKMPPGKKTMLESRLAKRLRSLGMRSYKEYKEYLFSLKGLEIEMPHLIDAVTTNKTEFFREAKHFEILSGEILPAWYAEHRGRKPFTVWSAGCSTGEEPYTLAMVLCEFQEAHPDFRFQVLGTDISQEVLQRAKRAVYPEERSRGIPEELRRKYVLRSKDRSKGLIRIAPELRSLVAFRELNLMGELGFRERFEAIFCRNVIIYFERPIQESLFGKITACLTQGGHLFIGHSETLNGMDVPLRQVRPTVYTKV
jgi:chemotaxis protein methyltransferase CheR